jgi:hypothetical protein
VGGKELKYSILFDLWVKMGPLRRKGAIRFRGLDDWYQGLNVLVAGGYPNGGICGQGTR